MKKIFSVLALLLTLLAGAQEARLRPLNINLANYAYPFPVHRIHLNIQRQALQMAYMDIGGSPGNQKVVVLLHGKNFNGAYWEQTARALANSGFRVIIPDQIGFGKSSKPQHLQYSFQLLAMNTKALLDSLGIGKAAIVCHSMGGMVGTRFALMYPAITEKLVLANPIGLEDWKTMAPYVPVDKQYTKELAQTYASMKKYQVDNYYHGTWKPEYEKWLNLLAGWTLSKDYPTIAWNAALTSDMIFTQPVVYEFRHIKVPTLLIIGQADRTAIGKDGATPEMKARMGNYPVLGRQIHGEIAGSKLVEIEGVGHLPHIEAFDKFIGPLVAFLQ